jgi:hypothetical protein
VHVDAEYESELSLICEVDAQVTAGQILEIEGLETGQALRAVALEEGALTAAVNAVCSLDVEGTATFQKIDPIDRDLIRFGSDHVRVDSCEQELTFLVKFEFDGTWEFLSAELDDQRISVDFGSIEPSWLREGPYAEDDLMGK